ncbi:NAD-dependent epimerase/dehydratase [Corchorus olitorius]|uniref:NAD-dependent epimerase/dehydratase n=1 Tax=Corchorus olitorius TaxID=93759 RepID=A0A1R3JNY9_9ROSI|nr:NAD-dependent epimerase/dehydratase [Corchorus olitorius]
MGATINQSQNVVCVTGASGFIASWLVKLLLQHGYTVKATVRDPRDKKKTDHLVALEGAKERLQLFKAELLDEGAFDSIVDGCIGVFHTASPCFHDAKDPQAELIDPAVKGTLNVVRSCAKVASIKRVIITSSLGAVLFTGKPLVDDDIVDETWFSDPDFCEKSKLWYMLSKTLAEKAAWKFAEEHGIDMITIHPGVVCGPLLQPTLNMSCGLILNLIGAEKFPNETLPWIDVRDVANAHILAFENSSARGRYCIAGRPMHSSKLVQILRELYPALNLPDKCSDEIPLINIPCQFSSERVESLGINFTPLELSLKDTVESLKQNNPSLIRV